MRCTLAFGLTLFAATAAAQTKLLRFPDIAGDRVAFCYAGDIWTAPAEGGSATRSKRTVGVTLGVTRKVELAESQYPRGFPGGM